MGSHIPGLDSINWGGIGSQASYWGGIILVTLIIFGIFAAIWFLSQYKYKITIMERRGSGNEEYDPKKLSHGIGRILRDRAKVYKDKGVTKWKLLKSKKSIEPPDFGLIYPGNHVFLARMGPDSYIPCQYSSGNPSGNFSPIPQHTKYWQLMEIRQAAEDYQKQSGWDKYGNMVMMMGTIMFCLILVGVTVYYTYQHANGVTQALGGLTNAVSNANVIPAFVPGQ